MNLNRNNYENFFLLYVDGELSPQEMREVDDFCQKHPDLAEELQLLMETRLAPDHETVLLQKDELLKPEQWDADHLTPVQSALLAMLDGEAAPPDFDSQLSHNAMLQKEWDLLRHTRLESEAISLPHKHQLIKATEWNADQLSPVQQQLLDALDNGSPLPASVLTDPELQKDWMLLQQSILPADVVAMPGKERLYRNEAEKAPVIRLAWWRVAAAAAVLAGIGWVLFNSLVSTEPPERQLGKQQKQTPPVMAPDTNKPAGPDQQAVPATTTLEPSALLASNDVPAAVAPTKRTVDKKDEPRQAATYDERMANNIAAYRLSLSEEQALRDKAATTNAPDLNERGRAPVRARDYADAADALVANHTGSHVQFDHAVMTEPFDDEEEYISIGGARVKAQKIRGVLRTVSRKVTRSFDKSTVAPAETRTSEMR